MDRNAFLKELNFLHDAFGGWNAMSRGTGIPRSTVDSWWRGSVPSEEYVNLVDAWVDRVKLESVRGKA